VAGRLGGNHKQMSELLKRLQEFEPSNLQTFKLSTCNLQLKTYGQQ
jgi:hypothetical protein